MRGSLNRVRIPECVYSVDEDQALLKRKAPEKTIFICLNDVKRICRQRASFFRQIKSVRSAKIALAVVTVWLDEIV